MQDGFKLWGDISHHHQHLTQDDITPPMLEDGEADEDYEDVDFDSEEAVDAREDAKVDKVWLATVDLYLAMVIARLSSSSSPCPVITGTKGAEAEAEARGSIAAGSFHASHRLPPLVL